MSHNWSTFEKQISGATSPEELEHIEHELFGRKSGLMTIAFKELRDLSGDQKKDAAKELNSWKEKLETTLVQKRLDLSSSDKSLKENDPIDITLSLPQKERGHLHLIPEFIRTLEEIFGRMGFDVYNGPEMELDSYNFDGLNYKPDHPARDAQDTFFVDSSADDKVLMRTHTSSSQVRYMKEHKPPFRMACIGKCYRKDADATHSPMFHQFEGLMVGKDISIAHLQGVLIAIMKEAVSPDITFRFRTGYFPFVEPGLEMDVRWEGELEDSREGAWLEMGGCGMVHPNVLSHCGIDPDEWQGFAFGFGVERPIMIKHQIPDLRSFYEGDLRFLRQF